MSIKKIAEYTHARYGYVTILADKGDTSGYENESIRTSEYVDVEFPPRDKEETIPAMIERINADKEETVARLSRELKQLEDRKQSLLAITHQSEAKVADDDDIPF